MTTALSTDEFTLTEQGMWFVLESHPELALTFRLGNRIQFSGQDDDPGKHATLDADKPEVMLMPASGAANNRNTSGSVGFVMTYTVGIRTATKSTAKPKSINALVGMVYRAFEAWGDSLPACPWVRLVRLAQYQPSPAEQAQPDDVEGWVGVLTVTVESVFERGLMEVSTWQ